MHMTNQKRLSMSRRDEIWERVLWAVFLIITHSAIGMIAYLAGYIEAGVPEIGTGFYTGGVQ